MNFDCMDGEKALQEFTKHLARTVKSVSDLSHFNRLLARRLEEHLSVKKMLKQLCCDSTPFLTQVQNMMKHRQDSSRLMILVRKKLRREDGKRMKKKKKRNALFQDHQLGGKLLVCQLVHIGG